MIGNIFDEWRHFWQLWHFWELWHSLIFPKFLKIGDIFDDRRHFWWLATFLIIGDILDYWWHFRWLATFLMTCDIFEDWRHFWWSATFSMTGDIFGDWRQILYLATFSMIGDISYEQRHIGWSGALLDDRGHFWQLFDRLTTFWWLVIFSIVDDFYNTWHFGWLATLWRSATFLMVGDIVAFRVHWPIVGLGSQFNSWTSKSNYWSTKRRIIFVFSMIGDIFDNQRHFWWSATYLLFGDIFDDWWHLWWLVTFSLIGNIFNDCRHFW